MSYLWYFLCVTIAAVWVFIDSRPRHTSRYWVVAVAVAGPIGLAAYLTLRPLLEGESREGGRAWHFFSMLAVLWTALLAIAGLGNVARPFADNATIAVAWVCIALPALVVGLALKRSTTEHAPSSVQSATGPWSARCERTPDGRAYICRECGKEYSIELPFCDGCGAWPGQSG